jgi:nitrate/nitrite-specific signal transduction histidine kinase
VAISLQSNQRTVELEVRDDGIGILNNPKEGLGLRIMQNRASVIWATLTIGPARPRGTVFICTLSQEHPQW